MKAPSSGNCVNCRTLIALRSDSSCPNCGLSDALRRLPTLLSSAQPNLKASVIYTAARVVSFFAAPALTLIWAVNTWGSWESVPAYSYPVALLAGLLAGLLLGRPLGAFVAYLPWLAVQGINRAVIAPYRASRLTGRREPTFQRSFEKLSQRRAELSEQLNQMYRALGKIRVALDARDARAISSKQRLAAAESALLSGIEARRAALESVDTVWYEAEYQLFECEVAAVRLLPCETAEAARDRLAQLRQLGLRLNAISERTRTLQDAGRRGRARRAKVAAEGRYRAACDHFQAVEDGSLLAHAARLLRDVRPTQEHHDSAPTVASFDTFDHGVTLLRISNAVTECVEERLRVEAELEAVAEVQAICEIEPEGHISRQDFASPS